MRLLPSPVPNAGTPGPETTAPAASGRPRRPVVERVACWSVRHRKTAVGAWLAFMAAAFIAGQLGGGASVHQYDPGQAGQAEQVLTKLGVVTPPAESVLIQAKPGDRLAPATAAAEVRSATAQVRAALAALPRAAADVTGPFSGGRAGAAMTTRDGLAALVTFNVAGPHAAAQSTVQADLAAVQRVQAAHPDLLVQEAGDASTNRVANALLEQDFRKSEWTSIPLTLILLLAVFGAVIAAGIPVLLAGTAVITAVSLLSVAGHWFPVEPPSWCW
jgi:putative drug exporter of the RND superfamily